MLGNQIQIFKGVSFTALILLCGCLQETSQTSNIGNPSSKSTQTSASTVGSGSNQVTTESNQTQVGSQNWLDIKRPTAVSSTSASATPGLGSGTTVTTIDRFSQMYYYDQTDIDGIGANYFPNYSGADRYDSQLCGPTAGSMVLQAIISRYSSKGVSLLTTNSSLSGTANWTKTYFLGKGAQEQIRQMYGIMGTDRNTGTYFVSSNGKDLRVLASRSSELSNSKGIWGQTVGSGGTVGPVNNSFDGDSTRAGLKKRLYGDSSGNNPYAIELNYGHYLSSHTVSGTQVLYTFKRDGGHLVAVSGFLSGVASVSSDLSNVNRKNSKIIVHDPYLGQREEYFMPMFEQANQSPVIQLLLKSSSNNWGGNPFVGYSYLSPLSDEANVSGGLIMDNSYFAIVEGHIGLSAP